MRQWMNRAFTLVEILIVVIILGILAAIVVPQMSGATEEAAETATYHELQKIRNNIEVYQARNRELPNVTAGVGAAAWGPVVDAGGQYMMSAPRNAWVGANGQVVVLGAAPDGAYQTTHGWIFDPASGQVWAGGFDANDRPHNR